MNNDPCQKLEKLLADLKRGLETAGLWSREAPSDAALSSTVPFCIDTLAFEEWLQYVFVPGLSRLMEAQLALPQNCLVTPMAQERFSAMLNKDIAPVLAILKEIDCLLSNSTR